MAKKGTKSTKKKSAYSKKKTSTSSTTKNRSTTGMPKKSVVASTNKQTSTTKKQTTKKVVSKVENTKPQLSSIYTKNEQKNDSLEDILLDKLFNYHEKPKKATTSKKMAKKDSKSTSKKTASTKQTAKKEVPKEQTVDKKKKEKTKVEEKSSEKVVPETPSTNVTPVEQPTVVSSEVKDSPKEAKSNIAVRILFFGFCFIVIVLFILFLNLNHIGDAVSEVVPQSDLTVSYDVSAIDPETSNVTITIHASSDVGLKRILLPNQKVKYLTNETDVSVQYMVNANGTYTFSVSDMSNSVSKVEVVVNSYT